MQIENNIAKKGDEGNKVLSETVQEKVEEERGKTQEEEPKKHKPIHKLISQARSTEGQY